jgi:hypothetical protein
MTKKKAPPKRIFGPRTPEGRERIAKAQRRRWRLWRKAKREAAKEATQ